jgi:branched-chain amino acid transport system substrate-binding protein
VQTRRLLRAVLAGALAAVGLAACGNAASGTGAAGGATEGLSAKVVRVGGLASLTGPLGDQYGAVFDGASAYFDMVDAKGGVDGRRIELVAELDDQTDPATDVSQARALVEQDKVFAVVPVATPVFAGGAYLAAHRVPTFGWAINPQWMDGPTMFGQDGSYIDFSGIDVDGPYLAKKLGVTKVAVLAYAVSQSAECAAGQAASFRKFGFDVVLEDASLPLGVTNVDADVARMKAAGAQLVVTCLDTGGNVLVSQALAAAGIHPAQYWLNGYDEAALHRFPAQYQGVYLSTWFVPFEEAAMSPGLEAFLTELHRYFPATAPSEVALAGWVSAAMFVRGLEGAGPHPTRASVVAAVNRLTAFTAGGIMGPVNWRLDHTTPGPYNCSAFVQAQGGHFVPVFHEPFTCLRNDAANLAQLVAVPGPAR